MKLLEPIKVGNIEFKNSNINLSNSALAKAMAKLWLAPSIVL